MKADQLCCAAVQNLKALFRSCAMVVPDIMLICENMLLSEGKWLVSARCPSRPHSCCLLAGFKDALRLAKKFVTLYSLSSMLLSTQKHYDWGLRATKVGEFVAHSGQRSRMAWLLGQQAVLRVAGGLKRAEIKVEEDVILMRALRDFNIPKLVGTLLVYVRSCR